MLEPQHWASVTLFLCSIIFGRKHLTRMLHLSPQRRARQESWILRVIAAALRAFSKSFGGSVYVTIGRLIENIHLSKSPLIMMSRCFVSSQALFNYWALFLFPDIPLTTNWRWSSYKMQFHTLQASCFCLPFLWISQKWSLHIVGGVYPTPPHSSRCTVLEHRAECMWTYTKRSFFSQLVTCTWWK